MVQREMGCRWIGYGIPLSCFVFLIVSVEIQGCLPLNLEGLALLEFRAKVDVDPYGALSNWNMNDSDPCMWSGVDCLGGNVNKLDLNGQELEGKLTPELGNLTHLRFLDLSKNRFSGIIPPQFGQLTSLEVLDLRENNFTGTVPLELGALPSLKILLLQNNSFKGSIPAEFEKLNLLTDLPSDDIILSSATAVSCANRKVGHCIWQDVLMNSKNPDSSGGPIKDSIIRFLNLFPRFNLGIEASLDHAGNTRDHFTDSLQEGLIQTVENHAHHMHHRILAEQSQPSNLAALPPDSVAPSPSEPVYTVPSRSSGSFPAISNKKTPPPLDPQLSPPPARDANPSSVSGSTSGASLGTIIGISIAGFLVMVGAIMFLVCKTRAAKVIVPWKTGLSGQLQKAFVTDTTPKNTATSPDFQKLQENLMGNGVPKLNRAELETACEDFSNIISTDGSSVTLYKGTLSSGVEIAVASTVLDSLKNWSKRSELAFRKKIDSLSRVNHKNFVNLIGYCKEDEPFTRMMVFEYAPNGTLFEHLHVEELEHIDWNQRMRIIMGTAYCLQYMHDLNPPVAHFNLTSKEIVLTDDYAAKIADISFWAELVAKSKYKSEIESEHSELPPLADTETNVYSYGIMLLEVISGKHTYSEEQGHLKDWAAQYLNDKKTINYLIDPSLKSFKDNELDIVCEVIRACLEPDVRKRPTMKEIILKLREALDISPEAATPRLSPLWWAELEILSAEAA